MIDLNNKIFIITSNSSTGNAKPGATRFFFKSEGGVVSAAYSGGDIRSGHLIGHYDGEVLNLAFHQVTTTGELKAGTARSVPSQNAAGKIVLHDEWQFTLGSDAKGVAILEEV
jgi:hypothetical protein